MNNNSFSNDNPQFVLSYELLCLLRWLTEHDAEKLKKIISKSLSNGLKHDLAALATKEGEEQLLEDMQYSIIEFFSLLETLMYEVLNEQAVQRAMEKNLMPAIDQIDSTICDNETVRSSVERATAKIDHNPKENPRDLLFKELLKRWKPHDKNILN